jgi:hypothetical protein
VSTGDDKGQGRMVNRLRALQIGGPNMSLQMIDRQ